MGTEADQIYYACCRVRIGMIYVRSKSFYLCGRNNKYLPIMAEMEMLSLTFNDM